MMPIPTLSRVRWLCRRGTQELDRLLLSYAERRYELLDDDAKRCFVALLEIEDDRLWDWFTGREAPPTQEFVSLVEAIRESY